MKLRFLVCAVLSCLLIASPCHAAKRTGKGAVKAEQPEAQPVPTPPPTLEQLPPVPPEVAFHGGELTITAQNSTMGDILKAVHVQTGAVVDVPASATERVVGQFGPGPARDVLASLLNGSHFNYILLGSATNPDGLERVILTLKSNSPVEPVTAQQASETYPVNAIEQPLQAANRGVATTGAANTAADDAADDSDDQDAEADDQQEDTEQADEETDQTDEQQVTGEAAQPPPNGQAPGVKTPEQLLQELQQQRMGTQPGMQTGVPPGLVPPQPH